MEQSRVNPLEKNLPAPDEKLLRAPTFFEKYKKYLILGLILFIIAFLFSFYKSVNKNTQPGQQTIILAPTQQVEITKALNTNWKTYTTNFGRYFFQYPPDWRIIRNENNVIELGRNTRSCPDGDNTNECKTPTIIHIIYNENKSDGQLIDYLKKIYGERNYQSITLNDKEGLNFDIILNRTDQVKEVFVKNKSYIYNISWIKNADNQITQDQFDKFLSTFKFPWPPYAPAKTYIDEDLGITFKYDVESNVIKNNNKICVSQYQNTFTPAPSKGLSQNNSDIYSCKGDYVEIFSKNPNQTLKDTIEEQFLHGYTSRNCFVNNYGKDNNSDGQQDGNSYASLSYPGGGDQKCQYAKYITGSFMANKNFPDKFAYFGGDPIYIGLLLDNSFGFIDKNHLSDFSNWKTVSSLNGKLNFKYPPDWNLESKNTENNTIDIRLSYIANNSKYQFAVAGGGSSVQADYIESQKEIITGYQFERKTFIKDDNVILISLIPKTTMPFNHIEMSFPSNDTEKYLQIFDQILSTFK